MKGSIALTTVIVISSLLLFSGITLILTSIDLAFATKDYNGLTLAKIRASSCFEESLLNIKNTPTFTGTGTITATDGSCTYTVSNESVTIKSILITSTFGEFAYSETKRLDTSFTPYKVL